MKKLIFLREFNNTQYDRNYLYYTILLFYNIISMVTWMNLACNNEFGAGYLNPFLYLYRSPILLVPRVSLCGIRIMRTPRPCSPYILSNCTVIDRYANKRFSARRMASRSTVWLRVLLYALAACLEMQQYIVVEHNFTRGCGGKYISNNTRWMMKVCICWKALIVICKFIKRVSC